LEVITNFFSHFIQPDPKTALLVVLNLILIESLLSVDNAAVLATMVMDLPEKNRRRALRIGLMLAYIFRGTALVFASILIKINWLKLVGGGYLIYLCGHFFYKEIFKHEHILDIEKEELQEGVKHPKTILGMNQLWSTVVMVEMMDLTFSLDNVFAAVAFTNNIYLVCLGVFIGIITMRIVAFCKTDGTLSFFGHSCFPGDRYPRIKAMSEFLLHCIRHKHFRLRVSRE